MRDNFFNAIFSGGESDSFPALSFENRIVRRVFSECGISPRMGVLVNRCRAETGAPHFSFDWFNENFPEFPGVLSGARIGYCGTRVVSGVREKRNLYQLDFSDLFRAKKNLFIRALADNLHKKNISVDSVSPFIFVFPVRRKMYCAHNFGQPLFPTVLSSETVDDPSPPQTDVVLSVYLSQQNRLTVQPTAAVFGGIGGNWYSEPV